VLDEFVLLGQDGGNLLQFIGKMRAAYQYLAIWHILLYNKNIVPQPVHRCMPCGMVTIYPHVALNSGVTTMLYINN
jgi:hypothetical protein